MNSLRKLVAGPKVRTVENGFDLDLTYVTERVIAMAFPGSGIEALYRNSIDDVVQFLREKHNGNFMIFNLSGRKYDYEKFNGKVKEYDWEDHQAPALYTIFEICQQAVSYLQRKFDDYPENKENVVIMHCNHGKGRTGTIIVSLLLFVNFFTRTEEALQFYAKRRFQEEGYGVTQPCQIRYIQYFHALLIHKKINLVPYFLREARFRGTYNLPECYITAKSVRSKAELFKSGLLDRGRIFVQNKYLMMGDIFLEIMLSNIFGDKHLARLNFNTIFIPNNGVLKFKADEISPDSLIRKHKDKINEDFELELEFQRFCDCDLSKHNPTSQCKCQQLLAEQRMYWDKIFLILKTYNQPSKEKCIELLFGQGIHQFKE